MPATLTVKQRKMLWSLNEMEAEVRRLRFDARLAGLDGHNATARKFNRQADLLARMLVDRTSGHPRLVALYRGESA